MNHVSSMQSCSCIYDIVDELIHQNQQTKQQIAQDDQTSK